MGNFLRVDTSKMQSTARNYDNALSDLAKAESSLKKAIEQLRTSGWKSGASAAFFRQYDDRWSKSFQVHMTTIKHLKDSLSSAQHDYEALADKAANLTSDLR